jgi:peptidyl-prolyl cis-trans isomerase C
LYSILKKDFSEMKRLGAMLNTKLPDGCGWLVKLPLALGLLILVADIVGVMEPAFRLWKSKPDKVALVNNEQVSRVQLQERMRALLWRSGESWKELSSERQDALRETALEQLIDDCRLKRLAMEAGASSRRQSSEAFQQFLKQFEGDEWRQRAEWQGMNEVTLERSIAAGADQLAALNAKLGDGAQPVSEAQAKAWYEAHRQELINPERVHVSHIFLTRHDVKNPERAVEIAAFYQKLTAEPSSFAALAAKHSDDERTKNTGGDLGWLSRERVPADFAEKVFSLEVGQISAPFTTRLGWHIVILHEKRPSRPLSFDEARPEIVAMLEDERRAEALKTLTAAWRSAPKRVQRFDDRIGNVEPAPIGW